MVSIDKTSSKPYYEQLMLSVKEDILHGVLKAGDQLPSVREMAQVLMMNPNTISKAYKLLETEQVLVTVKGKGTFVKHVDSAIRDTIRIQQVRERMKELVIEAFHLNVSEKEITEWVHEEAKGIKGDIREDSETY